MSELVANPAGGDLGLRQRLELGLKDWRRLSRDNKSVLTIALLAAIVAATIVVILWTSSQNYVPLYGKQELYDTANIMELLEKEQVPFRLEKSSGQVLVPENQLAQVRMALAARGVRAALPAGMEGLSNVTGLGTSEFMEGVRYRHALEGELARTIISLDAVRSARVHLAIPKRTLFVGREEEQPTASVLLDMQPGQSLESGQVEAITNLVAGSISGMKPSAVSVVDQTGQLLTSDMGDKAVFGKLSVQQMDYVHKLEQYIRQRAGDMLQPMLGTGNFRVQVAADVNFNVVEETQEQIDPNSVVSQESGKNDKSIDALALGIPGALSNRPPETAANAANQGNQQNGQAANQQTAAQGANNNNSRSESTEFSKQYQNSRAVTHTRYQQGRVSRLDVSVLLNSKMAPKEGWNEAQLEQIRQMVERAVGFDAKRGDQISLQSFVFSGESEFTPAELKWWESPIWQNSLRYLVGGILGVVLVIFGIRPLVKHLVRIHNPSVTTDDDQVDEALDPALPLGHQRQDDDADPPLLKGNALMKRESPDMFDDIDLAALPEPGSELEVQLKHLQLLVEKDTDRVAEVIKAWVSSHD
jgi:flagellar M-ring protein FliF